MVNCVPNTINVLGSGTTLTCCQTDICNGKTAPAGTTTAIGKSSTKNRSLSHLMMHNTYLPLFLLSAIFIFYL